MIVLITGASHTGKTALAQKLLEKYHYPYLSMDHLKMGHCQVNCILLAIIRFLPQISMLLRNTLLASVVKK